MDRPLVRMNFGCGPTLARDWINVDRDAYHRSSDDFFHVDVTNSLPWGDDHFDGIVANHSLQCVEGAHLDFAVSELRRVMLPNGVLRVLVPDVVAAFLAWEKGDATWPGFVAISEDWDGERKLCHYLTWGGQNRSMFTQYTLASLLLRNGYRTVINAANDTLRPELRLRELDSRLGESIVVEAYA